MAKHPLAELGKLVSPRNNQGMKCDSYQVLYNNNTIILHRNINTIYVNGQDK